ncbi:MAG: hypothetical protein ABIH82_00875 [Candidatus Woesearchaeota archaeon]
MMHPSPYPQSHTRFYIVLVTLVIGGIFLLLVMNDDGNKFDLTGSSVGLFDNGSSGKAVVKDLLVDSDNTEEIQKLRSREVNVLFSFDSVPEIKKETKIQNLDVKFTNPGTPIMINEDYLELGDLEEISLKLEGFSGKLGFDEVEFSLEGKAKSIQVNGMTFSSKNELSILLDEASYSYLMVDEIELKDIHLPEGSGQLDVADKLSYSLEQEGLNFYSFVGKIVVDQTAENLFGMEGVAKGIDVSGAFLNLDVR